MADHAWLSSLSVIDPELQQHFNNNPQPKVSFESLAAFKALVDERNKSRVSGLGPPPSHIKQDEVFYEGWGGRKLRAKLYRPTAPAQKKRPLIVIFHGGGFCLGLPEAEEQTCRNFVSAFGAVCVAPSYALSPEHVFPTAILDSHRACEWAASMASEWGADLTAGFIVGGTSAGAQITSVMAHMSRDGKLQPPITGHYLAGPALNPADLIPEKYKEHSLSWEQNKNAPVLPREAVQMFYDNYKPDPNDGERWAILNHPNGHKDVSPVFLQIAGLDPFRDEALIYELALREAGVKTKREVYPGQPHGFWGWFPELEQSKKLRLEQVQGMGWLLGMDPDMTSIVLGGAGTST